MKVSNSLSVQTQTNTPMVSKPAEAAKPDTQCTLKTLVLDNNLILNPLIKKSDSIPAVDLKHVEPIAKDCNKEEVSCLDKVLGATNVVSTTVNVGGTLTIVPGEAIKHAATLKKVANTIMTGSMINLAVSTPASVQEKVYATVAKSAAQVIRLSNGVTFVAGKFNYEKVAGVANNKVLPTVGAVLSGIAIYSNSKRYLKAHSTNNKTEMLKASTQITLNAVSGVTGYIPGRGQVISVVTGLSSLISDKLIDGSVAVYRRVKH